MLQTYEYEMKFKNCIKIMIIHNHMLKTIMKSTETNKGVETLEETLSHMTGQT